MKDFPGSNEGLSGSYEGLYKETNECSIGYYHLNLGGLSGV